MSTKEANRRNRRVAIGFLFGLSLSWGSPVFGQLPGEVTVEPGTRTISRFQETFPSM